MPTPDTDRVSAATTTATRASLATSVSVSAVFEDGIFAGVIGAAALALWFLLLDALHGRPLYTPALLGTLVLHGPAALRQTVIAPQPVAVYTGIHFLLFFLAGVVASWLWAIWDVHPITGFVIVVGFVAFETGFFALDFALGFHVLGYLSTWAVAVGNLLAAGSMAGYLWLRHPHAARHMARLWDEE